MNASPVPLPYSNGCFVCGKDNPRGLKARFRIEGDEVAADFTPHREFNGYLGMTHGGVVSAILDEAMGWATIVRTRRFFHTAELQVRFRRPTPTDAPLQVRARAVSIRGRVAMAEGEILDADGVTLVKAQAKYIQTSEEETRAVDAMMIYEDGMWRIVEQDE